MLMAPVRTNPPITLGSRVWLVVLMVLVAIVLLGVFLLL
jgi:hypothetical protein